MEQVIDEPDECVLSTDQLTLMRLRLLQAKYFPLMPAFLISLLRLSPTFEDGKVLLEYLWQVPLCVWRMEKYLYYGMLG